MTTPPKSMRKNTKSGVMGVVALMIAASFTGCLGIATEKYVNEQNAKQNEAIEQTYATATNTNLSIENAILRLKTEGYFARPGDITPAVTAAISAAGLQNAAQVNAAIEAKTAGLQDATEVAAAIASATSGFQNAAQVNAIVAAAMANISASGALGGNAPCDVTVNGKAPLPGWRAVNLDRWAASVGKNDTTKKYNISVNGAGTDYCAGVITFSGTPAPMVDAGPIVPPSGACVFDGSTNGTLAPLVGQSVANYAGWSASVAYNDSAVEFRSTGGADNCHFRVAYKGEGGYVGGTGLTCDDGLSVQTTGKTTTVTLKVVNNWVGPIVASTGSAAYTWTGFGIGGEPAHAAWGSAWGSMATEMRDVKPSLGTIDMPLYIHPYGAAPLGTCLQGTLTAP